MLILRVDLKPKFILKLTFEIPISNVIFILHYQQSARLLIFVMWVLMLILHLKRCADNANLTRKCNFKNWFLMKIWLESYLEKSNWLYWPDLSFIEQEEGTGQANWRQTQPFYYTLMTLLRIPYVCHFGSTSFVLPIRPM